MASILKVDKGWRVQINIKGEHDDRTFSHKTQATDWAVKREAEIRSITGGAGSKTHSRYVDFGCDVQIAHTAPPLITCCGCDWAAARSMRSISAIISAPAFTRSRRWVVGRHHIGLHGHNASPNSGFMTVIGTPGAGEYNELTDATVRDSWRDKNKWGN